MGGDRWRARAIPGCTAESRCSRRRARSRSATSTRISISPVASKRTPLSISGYSVITTGDCRKTMSGRWSACCSNGRTGESAGRRRESAAGGHGIARSATCTTTSPGSSIRAASDGRNFPLTCGAGGLLRLDGLFEERFAPARLVGKDPRCLSQFWLIAAFRFLVRNNPAEVRVDDKDRVAARAPQFELAFQLGHTDYSSGWLISLHSPR